MLSDILTTNKYDGRYYQLEWTATQSVTENTSTINWILSAKGGNVGYYYEHSVALTMNNVSRYSSTNSIPRYKGEVASGSFKITHDANGEATFNINLEVACYYTNVNLTASKTGIKLDTIPRKAIITSAPDFTDEANPVIKYTNPAGSAVTKLEASITIGSGVYGLADYREIPLTGTYTFNLDDTEREAIRNAAKNANSIKIRFYLKTTIGSNFFYHYVDRKVTIINCNPTIEVTTNISDSYTKTVNGNVNNVFIKSFTDVYYKIKPTTYKGATIESYRAICGSQVKTTASGTLEDVRSGSIFYEVTDSRGNVATASFVAEIIDYKNLTCNLNVDVPTADGATTLRISGAYSGITFGSASGAQTNQLKVYYKMVTVGEEDTDNWIEITSSVNIGGNSYQIDFPIGGLDYTKKYNFYAKAIDKISSVTTDAYPVKTLPVFDWGENDFNFNVPVTITDGDKAYNLLGALKAMTTAYTLTTTATAGTNYSSASGSATLVGNSLRVWFNVTRKTATGTGDITNETICTLSVNHGGKIKSSYNVGYINGSSGAVSSFTTSTSTGSEILTITLALAATTAASTNFAGYFVIPVSLNLDKY